LSFWLLLYEAFKRVNGYAMSAVGVLLSVVLWLLPLTSTISVKVLVPVGAVLLVVILTLGDAAIVASSRAARLPRVVRGFPPSSLYADASAILLLEPSDLFSHDAMTSVFNRQDGLERFIGVGFVATVQEDQLVQVVVKASPGGEADPLWERIRQNNADELSRLLVKPSVPQSLVE